MPSRCEPRRLPGYSGHQSDDSISLFYSSKQVPLAATTATASQPAVQVYPNPTHHGLHVALPVGEPASPATLFDGLSRTVRQWLSSAALLTVDDLLRGVYVRGVALAKGPAKRRIELE